MYKFASLFRVILIIEITYIQCDQNITLQKRRNIYVNNFLIYYISYHHYFCKFVIYFNYSVYNTCHKYYIHNMVHIGTCNI